MPMILRLHWSKRWHCSSKIVRIISSLETEERQFTRRNWRTEYVVARQSPTNICTGEDLPYLPNPFKISVKIIRGLQPCAYCKHKKILSRARFSSKTFPRLWPKKVKYHHQLFFSFQFPLSLIEWIESKLPFQRGGRDEGMLGRRSIIISSCCLINQQNVCDRWRLSLIS